MRIQFFSGSTLFAMYTFYTFADKVVINKERKKERRNKRNKEISLLIMYVEVI